MNHIVSVSADTVLAFVNVVPAAASAGATHPMTPASPPPQSLTEQFRVLLKIATATGNAAAEPGWVLDITHR